MAHNPMGKDPADYESEPIFNATTQQFNMVNTRTGLFEAYLKMPPVTGNAGFGPSCEMGLFYSPLTNNMFALGDGWEFSFAIYSEEHKKLTLNSGETLAIEKNKNEKQPTVIVEWQNDDTLTVERKGGRTEVLKKLGDTLFYLPYSLTTDGYNYLTFDWIATPHLIDDKTYYQIMLKSIQDKTRTLLKIEYTLADENAETAITPAIITYWPDDPAETLRYQLTIENYALKSVALADDINASFDYLDHESAGWLLTRFNDWHGLVDELVYSDDGLTFPDNPTLSALPCVNLHRRRPNGGGSPVLANFRYDRNSSDSFYTTTKTEGSSDDPKTTTYNYDNKSNEIISETTTYKSSKTATKYKISATPIIDNERTITYTQNNKSRTISIYNTFNNDGALTNNIQRGTRKNFRYSGTEKFPSSLLKEEQIFSTTLLSPAISLKQYSYKSINGISEQKLTDIVEISAPPSGFRTQQHIIYFEDDDFRKGQKKQVSRRRGSVSEPDIFFEYTLDGIDNSTLTTVTTQRSGSVARTSSQTQSILSGRLIQQTDTDGNRAEYDYDAFGRLKTHTLCAQSTTYKQVTTYAYPARGHISVTGPDGVVHLSEYDGRDRVVREYEFTSAGARQLTKQIEYDELGREAVSIQYDYQRFDGQIEEWSHPIYNEWNEPAGRIHNGGLQTFNQYDPIAMTRTEWSGKASDKHRKVTTYNPDDTIKKIEWFGQDGKVFQTQTATYTNNNLLQHLRTQGDFGVTTINYTYDDASRLLKETHTEIDNGLLPPTLNHAYQYTYAETFSSDEPASIEFILGAKKYVLGQRTLDNWGRTTSITRGTATETFTYDGASPVPASSTTADGVILQNEYIKELGNKLKKVGTQDGQQQIFTYASANQQRSTASEAESRLESIHDEKLRVIEQRVQVQPGESRTVSSRFSLAGRLLSATDALGKTANFIYDDKARRFRSDSDDLALLCSYTEMGELSAESISFPDGSGANVDVSYTYDSQQREISRLFQPAGNIQVSLEIVSTYYAGGQLRSVQLKNGSQILGSRSFSYSAGGRLKSCQTTGVCCPLTPKKKKIEKEAFTYDGLGNVIKCITTFVGGQNTATYTYDASSNSRLQTIKNSHADYPPSATLSYDRAGRVTQDQTGKKYTYDWLGRLIQAGSTRYSYDPSNRLMTYDHGQEQRQTLYNEFQITGDYALGDGDSNRRLEAGSAACTVQRVRRSGVERTLLEWREQDGTVWVTCDVQAGTTKFHAYTSYGEQFVEDSESLLGAKGEFYDDINHHYPLGAGYRYLNPVTRQFNAWDKDSPFGKGGPHTHGYCAGGDPINFSDPSGHSFDASKSLSKIWGDRVPGPLSLGENGSLISTIIFTSIGVLTAVMTGGASLLLYAASVAFAVVSAGLAIASEIVAGSNPELASALGWASLAFGVAIGGAMFAAKLAQKAAQFVRYIGNTTGAVGKNVYARMATLSPARKILSKELVELPKNMDPIASLRLKEPFPFNTKTYKALPESFGFGDLNTLTFAVTGVLGLTDYFEEAGTANEVNSFLGNGTWLPNGHWQSLWLKVH
ncbi:hypothetical protein HU755_14710 [Pseudomonas sp. SWRI111]|uniref:RHS repeat domain-containing protein n=1 Tax=Pseudomonas sp. SWRI111 TaxID=2745507 RepID=UPI001647942A|nr:hypothetical protein [Pseudomonas sp. SWRI111]MBC3208051.1 hypothetical protein [Pseudomonas sp. SWRI111]